MQHQELVIKSLLDAWNSHVSRTNNLLDTLTEEQLLSEVAPGKNRGIYLLGHLTAVHDRMFPLLGLGTQHYPHFDDIFITSPDKVAKEMPPVAELRGYWQEVNNDLRKQFTHLTPDEWFHKHTSVSDEDFAKEPFRNRLNVLISRTNHLAYHFGQLMLLKK